MLLENFSTKIMIFINSIIYSYILRKHTYVCIFMYTHVYIQTGSSCRARSSGHQYQLICLCMRARNCKQPEFFRKLSIHAEKVCFFYYCISAFHSLNFLPLAYATNKIQLRLHFSTCVCRRSASMR